jgi:hypothetical protein
MCPRHYGEAGAHCSFSVILMRCRIPELGENAGAKIIRDDATQMLDLRRIGRKKLLTTSRCSSWWNLVESAVEPTMSQNMIVT